MHGGERAITILIFIAVIGVGLFLVRSGVVSKVQTLTTGLVGLFPSSTKSIYPSPGSSSTQTTSQPVPWYMQPPPQPQQVSPTTPWYLQQGTSSVNQADIPAGYTADQISPHFHKVRFGSVSAGSYYYVGQISLRAGFYGNDAVNVTGWTIRGNYGGDIVPQAINLYDPSGLAGDSDIVLRSGDYVNIYNSASAIGRNLRLNKCTGYLQNNNKFNPSLPQDCPGINRSEITGFSGVCQNYISSLYGCALPAPNPPVPQNDYGCIAYLNTINFRGCYERHGGDADFLSHEWRVWTNHRFLDQYHDKVLLLDRNGLLVDLYQY